MAGTAFEIIDAVATSKDSAGNEDVIGRAIFHG